MATYYVDAAAGGGGDGSIGTPFNTFAALTAVIGNGDTAYFTGTFAPATRFDMTFTQLSGKAVTFAQWPGQSAPVFASTGPAENMRITGSNFASGSSITFNDMTFTPVTTTGATNVAHLDIQVGGTLAVIFNRCTFTDTGGRVLLRSSTDGTGVTVTYNDCIGAATWVDTGTVSNGSLMHIVKTCGLITIDGGTWTMAGPTNGIRFAANGTSSGIYIVDAAVVATGLTDVAGSGTRPILIEDTGANFVNLVHIKNVPLTTAMFGFSIAQRADTVIFDNVDVIHDHATGRSALSIGVDGAVPGTPVSTAIIRNCSTSHLNGRSHGILIGAGVSAGYCGYNYVYRGDNGYVLKSCSDVVFECNVAIACNADGTLYMRGASDCSIVGNTLRQETNNKICVLLDDVNSMGSKTNRFYNNVFSVPSASSAAVISVTPAYSLTGVTTAAANAICLSASAAAAMVGMTVDIVSGTNFLPGTYVVQSVVVGVSFTLDRTCTSAAGALGVMQLALSTLDDSSLDNNIYGPGSGTVISSNGITLASLAAIQTHWLTYGSQSVMNDRTTLVADPMYVAAGSGELSRSSPGFGTLGFNGNMGAYGNEANRRTVLLMD